MDGPGASSLRSDQFGKTAAVQTPNLSTMDIWMFLKIGVPPNHPF